MEQPSSSTPLISLPAAAIDTETTGLDPRSARLVQIAAVRLVGTEIRSEEIYESLVTPSVPIPPASSAIHGIYDKDVEAAPDFRGAWEAFNAFAGPHVLIGYRTKFDINMMKRECALAGLPWIERYWLCVQMLARLVAPLSLADESLEGLCQWLGVTVEGRHTAPGDAIAAAEIWAALVPLLRQKGIRTLGEALTASAEVNDTQMREIAQMPTGMEHDASALPPAASPVRIDSYAYRHSLGDVMSAPPVVASGDTSLSDAAQLLLERRVSSVLVEDDGKRGIVTERDLLRAFAAQSESNAAATLGSIMSHPLQSLPDTTHLYLAMARMNRLDVRHLAVTDGDDRIVGIVTPRNLLRARANAALILGDAIETAPDGASLAAARARLPDLARGLLEDDLDARGVCAVISTELCNLTRRVTQISEIRMEEAGLGKPPAPYAVMVLGSGGRGESLLAPDQDNAIIYQSGEPGGPEDTWFEMLGGHIADLLDEAGIPYCKGGVMARNREWRKSLDGWQAAIDDWVRRSRPEDLLSVDIFFDGVPVHGDAGLAEKIWRYAYKRAHGSTVFQKLLTEVARDWSAPLGLFGSFLSDKSNRTDLKRGGLMPIFTGGRVLSIRHLIHARSTAERLRGLVNIGELSEETVDTIMDTHETILKAILSQQLRDLSAGVPLSNSVETGRLGRVERQRLRYAIRSIGTLTDIVSEGRF